MLGWELNIVLCVLKIAKENKITLQSYTKVIKQSKVATSSMTISDMLLLQSLLLLQQQRSM